MHIGPLMSALPDPLNTQNHFMHEMFFTSHPITTPQTRHFVLAAPIVARYDRTKWHLADPSRGSLLIPAQCPSQFARCCSRPSYSALAERSTTPSPLPPRRL